MDSDYFSQTQNTSSSLVALNTSELAGTVLKVHVKNFMCHDNLEVKLNPRINFVCGKNGSGKSAVQTAIAVGLGGKALSTNRGSSMKALIKNDRNSCTIIIVLSNKGPLAYKPQEYGSHIQVERHFSHTTSGYKIRSLSGKLVTTEKKELDKIVAQFNIQTDNPVCILHQDIARNFLNSSDPKNKYKFYMKASRFDEITKLYSESSVRTQTAKEVVLNKVESVQETFRDIIELKKKLDIVKEAEKQQVRQVELENELVWAKIYEKNAELKELRKKREAEQAAKTIVEKKFKEGEMDSYKDKMSKCEEELQALVDSVKEAKEQLLPAREEMNRLKTELNNTKRDYEDSTKSAARAKSQYENCLVELDDLTKKAPNMQQRTENLKKEKTEIESKVERWKSTEEMVNHEIQQLRDTLDKHKDNLQAASQRRREIERQIARRNEQLSQLQGGSSSLSIYGHLMVRIVQEVEKKVNEGKFQKAPVGPIGKYIKVRDPGWAGAVENFLSKGFLATFCVDNNKDANVLGAIFKSVCQGQSSSQPPIICSKFLNKVHNIAATETGTQRYMSLARALQFEHPVVANCLIDQNEIEAVLLIPTNNEAMDLLDEQHKVPKNCKRAFTLTGDTFFPAPNYKSYSSMKTVTNATLLQANQVDIIRGLKNEVAKLKQDLVSANLEKEEIEKQMRDTAERANRNEKELHTLKQERNKYFKKLAEIKSCLEQENQTSTDWMIQESNDLKNNYEVEIKKSKDLSKQVEHLKSLANEAKTLYSRLSDIVADAEKKKIPIKGEITRLNSAIHQAQSDADLVKQKIRDHENKLSQIETDITTLTEEINGTTENASQLCGEPVITQRNVNVITRELKHIQHYLKRVEEENGGDFNVIQRNYNERQGTFKAVTDGLNRLKDLITKTEKCLKDRRRKRNILQKLVANSAKHHFQVYLQQRNFDGKLDFDMEKQTLDIKIIPQKEGAGNTLMGTSSLSGGEKSFSTVCFIMALWQEMQLPFHFLDEFDVFMDGINRRIVMDLLIEYATRVPQQFVFLTPLDTSSVDTESDYITIHRLEAPRN